jgi:hypothetical protein
MNTSTLKTACAAALLAIIHAAAVAGPGMSCERIEYAQLKDSSRAELVDAVCSARAKDRLDQELGATAQETFDKLNRLNANTAAVMIDMSDIREARLSCVRAADDALKMLKKKYGASAPSCK